MIGTIIDFCEKEKYDIIVKDQLAYTLQNADFA
jgi:hypothetical protein